VETKTNTAPTIDAPAKPDAAPTIDAVTKSDAAQPLMRQQNRMRHQLLMRQLNKMGLHKLILHQPDLATRLEASDELAEGLLHLKTDQMVIVFYSMHLSLWNTLKIVVTFFIIL